MSVSACVLYYLLSRVGPHSLSVRVSKRVCGPEYTSISACASVYVSCVWQRGLLSTGRSVCVCDIYSTLTRRTDGPAPSVSHFGFSLFCFWPHPLSLSLFITSLRRPLALALTFACQACQSLELSA